MSTVLYGYYNEEMSLEDLYGYNEETEQDEFDDEMFSLVDEYESLSAEPLKNLITSLWEYGEEDGYKQFFNSCAQFDPTPDSSCEGNLIATKEFFEDLATYFDYESEKDLSEYESIFKIASGESKYFYICLDLGEEGEEMSAENAQLLEELIQSISEDGFESFFNLFVSQKDNIYHVEKAEPVEE